MPPPFQKHLPFTTCIVVLLSDFNTQEKLQVPPDVTPGSLQFGTWDFDLQKPFWHLVPTHKYCPFCPPLGGRSQSHVTGLIYMGSLRKLNPCESGIKSRNQALQPGSDSRHIWAFMACTPSPPGTLPLMALPSNAGLALLEEFFPAFMLAWLKNWPALYLWVLDLLDELRALEIW